MAQETPPSTTRDPGDSLELASQAVASLTAQGGEAPVHPLQLPVGDTLLYNPWNYMAPSMMPSPSLNTAATLPSYRAQQNGADAARFDIPIPQVSRPPQSSSYHGESEVEIPGTNAQQPAKVPQSTETVSADTAIAIQEQGTSSEDLSDVQVSDGSEARVPSESAADLDRLDRYAFNHASQAYEHRVPQHLVGGITLYAEKVCMGTLIQQHLERAEKQGESQLRPTLVPHELEMKDNPKAVECIWVGILPAVPHDSGDAAAEAQSKDMLKPPSKSQKRARKAQSVISLEDDQLDIIPHDPNALRVVAKKQAKPVKLWHLYALTASDTGSKLCQGWKVPFEEVFFFKAFRDDTAAGLMKRRHATDLKIKAVTFPAESLPALAPQSSITSANFSASAVSSPLNPTTSNLPSLESSGKKGKSSRASRRATEKQAPKSEDPLVQEDELADSPAHSVEDRNGPGAEKQPPAGVDHRDLDTVDDDDGDDAYPEYAVSSDSDAYKHFLNNLFHQFPVAEPECAKLGQKRKRVAFDPGRDEVANNTRRKTGGSCRGDKQARGGENGTEPSSFVTAQQTDHLALKLKSMVNKLVAKRDVAGLRQCVTLMGCVEERSNPSHSSALAPYLSISSRKDAEPQACNGKLREILDLFPNLEKVESLDNQVLAFMVLGLRETGQSIEIGLVEPCIKSYCRLYRQKFGDNRPISMAKGDLIDMICQARDDAEKMLKKAPLNKKMAHRKSKKF